MILLLGDRRGCEMMRRMLAHIGRNAPEAEADREAPC
jgi:hypothetical protein